MIEDGPSMSVPLLYSEGNVAARVALEREVRGWSTTELAARMTKAGVPMNQTAVWRIESAKPRRKITLDEALGFSRVFELPLEELMSPPEEGLDMRARQLAQEVVESFYDAREANDRLDAAIKAIVRHIQEQPEVARGVHEQYRRLTADERIAHHLTLLTEEAD